MAVVVVLVLAEHGGAVPRVDDQGAVEEFAADAADEAFGDRVGPRRPYRCLDDADVGSGKHRVERGAELGVAVPDKEPDAVSGVVEVHEQIAGLLGEPGAGGAGGDPEDVYAAGGVLDDEERIQPAQGDGVEVEQVAGEDRVSLGVQELGPRWSGSPGRRGRRRRCAGSSRPWRRRSGSRGRQVRRGGVYTPRWGSRWPGG
jgi:hypothetical protein